MNKEKLILILLVVLIIGINYPLIDSLLIKTFEDYEKGVVERVIDGDTIVIEGESIRLLGINSPEKGEKYYLEAKEFLEEKILGKEVTIHFGKNKYDKYYRKLGYIYFKNKNINKELISNGLANSYFPTGKDKYYSDFLETWRKCLENNLNLCEKSKERCIVLENWDIENQNVILRNSCFNSVDLNNWSIKDEGRKKYVFGEKILEGGEIIEVGKKDFEKDYVWTTSGDSIFIRDHYGKLVFWDIY